MAAGKGPEAFRTIGEVADEIELPRHVLRFWETKFAQIRPLKRGGNRRFYRPQDVDLLRGIRQLLYGDGLTIKGVQKILRQHGVAYVMAIGRGEALTIDPPADVDAYVYPEIDDPQRVLPFAEPEAGGDGSDDGDDERDIPPAARGASGAARAEPRLAERLGLGRREAGEMSATEMELREILAELLDCKKRLDQAR
jgi:DNA-binding transcriptional MerR regulator